MGEEQTIQSLADVIAHTNALIQRGRDQDRKLVSMELLMGRYQASHGVALLFSRTNEGADALNKFVQYLVGDMNFQKALVVRMGDNLTIEAQKGFTDEELSNYTKDNALLRTSLAQYQTEGIGAENAELIIIDEYTPSKRQELFGLSRYLIGNAPNGKDTLFVIAGYDAYKGALYGNKYPLGEGDVYWFSQIVLLCVSFLDKMHLFNELKQKATENMYLAEQREKQIEERTRALLDALFDAKKFRLVIERADMLVALIDSASRRFIFVNKLWEQVTGFGRDMLIGKKTFDFLHLTPLERQPKLFSPEFDARLLSDGYFRGSFVYQEEHGDERALSLSISRFEDDAGGVLFVVIGYDISEERERNARERSRIEEVEKLNQLMINRELRIIELKRQLIHGSAE